MKVLVITAALMLSVSSMAAQGGDEAVSVESVSADSIAFFSLDFWVHSMNAIRNIRA